MVTTYVRHNVLNLKIAKSFAKKKRKLVPFASYLERDMTTRSYEFGQSLRGF